MKEAPTPFAFDITNLPQTVEQKTLAVLERIEKLLIAHWDDGPVYGDDGKPLDIAGVITKITPTETPLLKQAQGKKKR